MMSFSACALDGARSRRAPSTMGRRCGCWARLAGPRPARPGGRRRAELVCSAPGGSSRVRAAGLGHRSEPGLHAAAAPRAARAVQPASAQAEFCSCPRCTSPGAPARHRSSPWTTTLLDAAPSSIDAANRLFYRHLEQDSPCARVSPASRERAARRATRPPGPARPARQRRRLPDPHDPAQ